MVKMVKMVKSVRVLALLDRLVAATNPLPLTSCTGVKIIIWVEIYGEIPQKYQVPKLL